MPNESASFMTSLCLHVSIIVVLALISYSLPVAELTILMPPMEPEYPLESSLVDGSDGSVFGDDTVDAQAIMLTDSDLLPRLAKSMSELEQPPESSKPLAWLPIEHLAAATGDPGLASVNQISGKSSGMFSSSSLEGRSAANRRKFALQNGGSKESEAAVDAALEWFARHQHTDGSWSADLSDDPCKGRCRHGTVEVGRPKRIAATGLALLCFLGAGHTHREGAYKDVVYKALHYLVSQIKAGQPTPRDSRPIGRLLDEESDPQYEMYEQGIATLALCEAYEMTTDSILRIPIECGIDFIQRSQHADGSWGYHPNTSGDLSIVGWQIMALKSATKIGLKVRPEVIRRADKFLDSQQSGGGAFYGYRGPQREACTTAIGLLIRLYRGWSSSDPRILEGIQYINELGPSTDGIYYNYYATLLLFHMKYEKWSQWNKLCRDYLVQEQAQEGHEKGSWYFGRNHFNQVGGRLYNTAMATLTLEVYYRFMPIYSDIKADSFAL